MPILFTLPKWNQQPEMSIAGHKRRKAARMAGSKSAISDAGG